MLNKLTFNKLVYDIFTGFPFHKEIVHRGLDEEELNNIIQNENMKKKM